MTTDATLDPADVPLADVLAAMVVVDVPMHVRFRGVDHREVVLLEGPRGWGEFSPFVEYDDRESSWWLASALESAWSGWPEPLRDDVPVNATVPAVAPDEVEEVLARFPGCRTVKVKVAEQGQSLADDIGRVDRVRMAVGSDVAVRIDANGAWDVDDRGAAALAVLGHYDLQYVEQPCRTLEELVELRARLDDAGIGVSLAVDEGIRRADDPFAVAATGAVDVAVVKVAPLGGVRRTLAIAAELARFEVDLVVSSALDTSVGISAGVAAAAAHAAGGRAAGVRPRHDRPARLRRHRAPAAAGRRAAARREGGAGRRPAGLARRRTRAAAVVARAGAPLPRGAAGPLVGASHGGLVTRR